MIYIKKYNIIDCYRIRIKNRNNAPEGCERVAPPQEVQTNQHHVPQNNVLKALSALMHRVEGPFSNPQKILYAPTNAVRKVSDRFMSIVCTGLVLSHFLTGCGLPNQPAQANYPPSPTATVPVATEGAILPPAPTEAQTNGLQRIPTEDDAGRLRPGINVFLKNEIEGIKVAVDPDQLKRLEEEFMKNGILLPHIPVTVTIAWPNKLAGDILPSATRCNFKGNPPDNEHPTTLRPASDALMILIIEFDVQALEKVPGIIKSMTDEQIKVLFEDALNIALIHELVHQKHCRQGPVDKKTAELAEEEAMYITNQQYPKTPQIFHLVEADPELLRQILSRHFEAVKPYIY
ncbi:MAG: hypothetical protein KatS3mg083_349 [Candidatus Dojkabacteria bacterium]|nr:MAG: hypothetical protein KatS3mg084_0344 [Candidatus Dojkabacteria bacterium]GIW57404.1 MAG: hypothetical protein KatS3mg083_349 [Candidatus Dojkabacteria bacterium]